MTTTLPADAWVPVPLRWRHVIPGDVFVGGDGTLWHATHACPFNGRVSVTAKQGPVERHADVDPDDRVNVLVPVTEAEAVELTIEQLGARLVSRRTLEGS